MFQVTQNLLRGQVLKFDFFTVANLLYTFKHDAVAYFQSALDYENVLQFALNLDLALVGNIFLIDYIHILLGQNFKRRALRDDQGLLLLAIKDDRPRLAMSQ